MNNRLPCEKSLQHLDRRGLKMFSFWLKRLLFVVCVPSTFTIICCYDVMKCFERHPKNGKIIKTINARPLCVDLFRCGAFHQAVRSQKLF